MHPANEPELRRTALGLIRCVLEGDEEGALALTSADYDVGLLFWSMAGVAGSLVIYAAGDDWRALMDDAALQEAGRL